MRWVLILDMIVVSQLKAKPLGMVWIETIGIIVQTTVCVPFLQWKQPSRNTLQIPSIFYVILTRMHIVSYKLQSFGWHHFQWGKISQGRGHKDYLDKSKIGSARNLERSSHKILSSVQSPSIENENNTYSVSK